MPLPMPDNVNLHWAHGGLQRWVEQGIKPGSFLCSVLRNDLRGAVYCGDARSRDTLVSLILYCSEHLPSECWGSNERFDAWEGMQ